MSPESFFPSWQTMVTRSIAQPAWLGPDAPDNDVVISSRVRIARNLKGHRFPHHAPEPELREILLKVREAVTASGLVTEWVTQLSPVEQNYLVASRLISKDFAINEPGRAIIMDTDRLTSTLVNEEDHLRIQALSAGLSLGTAQMAATYFCERLGRNLDYAATPELGHLTASPSNAGAGIRRSVLIHVVGLAHRGELQNLVAKIIDAKLILRGLYGEATRATGALFQLSSTKADSDALETIIREILQEERKARITVGKRDFKERVEAARTFAISNRSISHTDALRVLSWVRWAAAIGQPNLPSVRQIDERIATLEAAPHASATRASRWRADILRKFIEQ